MLSSTDRQCYQPVKTRGMRLGHAFLKHVQPPSGFFVENVRNHPEIIRNHSNLSKVCSVQITPTPFSNDQTPTMDCQRTPQLIISIRDSRNATHRKPSWEFAKKFESANRPYRSGKQMNKYDWTKVPLGLRIRRRKNLQCTLPNLPEKRLPRFILHSTMQRKSICTNNVERSGKSDTNAYKESDTKRP